MNEIDVIRLVGACGFLVGTSILLFLAMHDYRSWGSSILLNVEDSTNLKRGDRLHVHGELVVMRVVRVESPTRVRVRVERATRQHTN